MPGAGLGAAALEHPNRGAELEGLDAPCGRLGIPEQAKFPALKAPRGLIRRVADADVEGGSRQRSFSGGLIYNLPHTRLLLASSSRTGTLIFRLKAGACIVCLVAHS